MTTAQDFIALIDKIETNLQEMGVDDAEFDSATGIMGLLDRILDIEGGGESLVINTSISADISPRKDFTVGETTTLSGQLTANSALDNIGNIVLAGATIKVYHLLERIGSTPNDYLIGSGTTDNTGAFSFPLTFQKSGALNLMAEFEGTTHFNSSQVFNTSNSYLVNKKSVSFLLMNDEWMLEPTNVDFHIGPQYKNAPISLMVGDTKYGPVNVDNSGNVIFDLSNLAPYGVYTSKLMVELNDMYSTAQSNTFNVSAGVDIHLNPDIRVTSTKDILSYADNERATITAQIVDSNGEDLAIENEEITFELNGLYDSLMQNNNQFDVTYGSIGFGEHGLVINDTDNAWYKDLKLDLCHNSYTLTMDCYSESGTYVIGYLKSKNGTSTQFQITDNSINVAMDSVDNIPISSPNITVKVELAPTSQKLYIDNNLIVESNLDFNSTDSSFEECKFGFVGFHNEYGISNLNIEGDIKIVKETNSSGNASFDYVSQGAGDVEFTISLGSLVTETFVVQDLPLYIKGDVANTSLFDIDNRKILNNASRGTVSLTTDGEYNVMTISGNGNYALIEMPVLSAIKSPFKISFIQDMNSGKYNGVTLENSTVYLFHYLKTTYRIVQSSTGYSSPWNVKSNESTPNGQYRQEVSILGSSAKIELIDMSNESVVYTKTISLPSNLNIESNNVRVGIHLINPATFKFKEFKVEPL